MSTSGQISSIWAQTVSLTKDRIIHRTLWETLEKTVALVLEGDTFVVGIDPRFSNEASVMLTSDHRNTIERGLREQLGRSVNLRVIEGTTLGDWEHAKEHDERVKAMYSSSYKRKDQEAAEAQSWEAVYEQVTRNYSGMRLRTLPQSRARHIREALALVSDAMDRLYDENSDDLTERHVARIIDRIANNAEVPAAVVALELSRIRTDRGTS